MHMRRVTDQTLAAVLAMLGACGVSAALADPPTGPDAAPAAAAAAASATTAPVPSAPAASTTSTPSASAPAAPAAAAPAKETEAALEKRLTNSGYKPRMHNGTKVWCKRQDELGSRLGAQEVCGTADELAHNVQRNQDFVEEIRKGGAANNPSGK